MIKKIIILTLITVVIASFTFAQIPPPGNGGSPPAGIPLDGGLGLLLAGLVGYAYKKFKK